MTNERASRAVFFDRDGTVMEDVDYCGDPRNVRAFPGAGEALRRLKGAGFRLFIITNQSGIGRGYFNEETYRAVDIELRRQLGDELIDASYHCPHAPDERCRCRKPSPQMLLDAADHCHLDLSRSFLIGDKATDIQCGRAAGVRTILVSTGYGRMQTCVPDWTAEDLNAAAEIVLANG